jgi:hypothetical protein
VLALPWTIVGRQLDAQPLPQIVSVALEVGMIGAIVETAENGESAPHAEAADVFRDGELHAFLPACQSAQEYHSAACVTAGRPVDMPIGKASAKILSFDFRP